MFALDVGTRKVAGLIADREGERVVVHDVEVLEHERRAMIDGQVHDIERVAGTVERVKRILESRLEVELDRVAIALAGRYLETVTGEATIDLEPGGIDPQTVIELELRAVEDAIKKLSGDEMFCVGYSVLRYELDGSWMMRLEGHTGKRASARVIAAFLPAQVVDAMTSVMKLVGLEIEHMTLEPIAAIELAVPEELRLLNIALVDVGAGTSDIAISDDGTIVAYGMVPKAGDEITEAISREFLLDFSVAERVKRSLSEGVEEFRVRDVLDNERVITAGEILGVVEPVVDEITSEIASKVLELNSKKPKAVMVIGGGAKVPGFVERLRAHLDLPDDRVNLKGVESLGYVEDRTSRVKGPEMVTPVGIAKSALFGKGAVFSKVYVNGRPVKLMGLSGRYTVMQVLLQAGYDVSQVVGRAVGTVVYEVNGEVKAHRGTFSTPVIKVNGERATTKTQVRHGDRVELEYPEIEVKRPKLRDVVGFVRVNFGEREERIYPPVKVNGERVEDLEREIEDGDRVEFPRSLPVSYIRSKLERPITVYVNGEPKFLKAEFVLLADGRELGDDDKVELGSDLRLHILRKPRVSDVVDSVPSIKVFFNGDLVELPTKEIEVVSKGRVLSMEDELEDGMELSVTMRDSVPIVATLLSKVDLDLRGIKRYKILKNGRETSFSEILGDGDEVQFVSEEG